MTREQLAWAGGFFEGEGGVSCTKSGRGNRNYMSAYVAQCNVSALERFRDSVFGMGKIYGPIEPSGRGQTPYYRWVLNGHEGVQALCAALWPFLTGAVRQKFIVAITKFRNERSSAHRCYRPMRKYSGIQPKAA